MLSSQFLAIVVRFDELDGDIQYCFGAKRYSLAATATAAPKRSNTHETRRNRKSNIRIYLPLLDPHDDDRVSEWPMPSGCGEWPFVRPVKWILL